MYLYPPHVFFSNTPDTPPVSNSPPADDDRSPEPIAQDSGLAPATPNFDGQTLAIKHVAAGSTACLDVSGGQAVNGGDVQTWDCNQSNAQQWTLEKRSLGRLRGFLPAGQQVWATTASTTAATSRPATAWASGVVSSDTDGAAGNQSVTIAAAGDGLHADLYQGQRRACGW